MTNKCRKGCFGQLEHRRVTQTFERKGSQVQVVIKNIPVTACRVCGEATMSLETLGQINEILRPFHGTHSDVPNLPPAQVFIDYVEAVRTRKAA